MGYRCPVSLILLGLAMALCPAISLGVPQSPSSPADPAPTRKGPTGGQAVPPQPQDFRTHSRSHVRLTRGDRTFDVYLYAPDEKAEVLDSASVFGSKGARQFSGRYQIISAADNGVVSRLDLDPDDSFVEKKPHDGLRLFQDQKSGQSLMGLFQYESPNNESVQFFSADPSGRLFLVNFLDPDGRTWKQMLTGPDGAIPHTADGAPIFCTYANTLGDTFCDAYSFDGENFQKMAAWMTPREVAAPAKGMNDASMAARTLFEFLAVLAERNYRAAAHYIEPFAQMNGGRLSAADQGQRAAFLERYCTVTGGQCFMPARIEAKPAPSVTGTLVFQVSFQNADFQPLKIGSRSTFDFRVAKTPTGFKVLDLPPQLLPDNGKQ